MWILQFGKRSAYRTPLLAGWNRMTLGIKLERRALGALLALAVQCSRASLLIGAGCICCSPVDGPRHLLLPAENECPFFACHQSMRTADNCRALLRRYD
jgi:hypothetical protein